MKKLFLVLSLLFAFHAELRAQKLFKVSKGQNLESVYGGVGLEESRDIIDFQSGFAMAGWQEISNNNKPLSVDASLWILNHAGSAIVSKTYGGPHYAEIGEGLARAEDQIFLAYRKTTEENRLANVSASDSLFVLGLDSKGGILWEFKHGSKNWGFAPKDVLVDSQGDIVVLVNSTNEKAIEGTSILKLNRQGKFLYSSAIYSGEEEAQGASAFELMEYGPNLYYTLCNNLAAQYPVSLLFDGKDSKSLKSHPHKEAKNVFLFGFDIDKDQGFIYSAGFSVSSGDTNAYIAAINTSFEISKEIKDGRPGMEMLKDIGISGETLIAGGLSNFETEGGLDVLIYHINAQDSIELIETMGSKFNETINHMRILKDDPQVYFTGQLMQLGVEEGNAYLGGLIANADLESSESCLNPRIAYVDNLFTRNRKTKEVNGTTALLTNHASFFQMVNQHNIEYVILYGADALMNQWYLNGAQKSGAQYACVLELRNLLKYAADNNESVRFGMAMGGWKPMYTNSLIVIDDIIAPISYLNLTSNSGKLSFFVLEDEFWNPGGNREVDIANEAGFRSSPRVQALLGSASLPAWTDSTTFIDDLNTLDSSVSDAAKAELLGYYYFKLQREHLSYLRDLMQIKNRSANIQFIGDYIGALEIDLPQISFWDNNKNYYFHYNVNTAAPNYTSTTEEAQRNLMADSIKTHIGVDGVFLANYVFASSDSATIDYRYTNANRKTARTLEAFMQINPNRKLPLIPILSAEDANNCNRDSSSRGFLGNWLGGPNSLQSAEMQWMNQYKTAYDGNTAPNYNYCPTCATGVEVRGMCWYLLNCVEANHAVVPPFSDYGLSPCFAPNTHVFFGQNELANNWSVYPNPAEDFLIINPINRADQNYQYQLLDINGRVLLSSGNLLGTSRLELSSLARGIYVLNLRRGNNFSSFKILH